MIGDYKIERGIPIPQPQVSKYPWRELNLGESFLVERPTFEITATWDTLSSCRCNAQRKTGRKFVLRRVIGGIRVWRVK